MSGISYRLSDRWLKTQPRKCLLRGELCLPKLCKLKELLSQGNGWCCSGRAGITESLHHEHCCLWTLQLITKTRMSDRTVQVGLVCHLGFKAKAGPAIFLPVPLPPGLYSETSHLCQTSTSSKDTPLTHFSPLWPSVTPCLCLRCLLTPFIAVYVSSHQMTCQTFVLC